MISGTICSVTSPANVSSTQPGQCWNAIEPNASVGFTDRLSLLPLLNGLHATSAPLGSCTYNRSVARHTSGCFVDHLSPLLDCFDQSLAGLPMGFAINRGTTERLLEPKKRYREPDRLAARIDGDRHKAPCRL